MTHAMKRVTLSSALLGALILMTAPHARASIITQTSVTTGQTYAFEKFGGTFAQFDPALGLLQSVTLTISGDVSYHAAVTPSPDCDECGVHFGFSTGYWFNAPGFPTAIPDFIYDFFAIASWSEYVLPGFYSDSRSIFYEGSPDSTAYYIGKGTVLIDGGISEDSDYCDSDGPGCDLSDDLYLRTTLTYEYARIPEPASLALFGAGLVAIAAARRRRSQSLRDF